MKNTETKAAKFEAGKTYYTTWRKSDGCEQIITCTIEKRTAHSVTINGKRHMIPRIDGTLAYPDIEYILVTADDGWKVHVDARNIYAAEAENNTEETAEINAADVKINVADDGKVIEQIKVDVDTAISIINRLNYRNDTFIYCNTTREDNADIKYRHFDAYKANGESDGFAITEIVVDGNLETVRFFNLFRDITVDLQIGNVNYTLGDKGAIVLTAGEEIAEDDAAVEAEIEIVNNAAAKEIADVIPVERFWCEVEILKISERDAADIVAHFHGQDGANKFFKMRATELDGSEEDVDGDNAFDLLPALDELNDVEIIDDTEDGDDNNNDTQSATEDFVEEYIFIDAAPVNHIVKVKCTCTIINGEELLTQAGTPRIVRSDKYGAEIQFMTNGDIAYYTFDDKNFDRQAEADFFAIMADRGACILDAEPKPCRLDWDDSAIGMDDSDKIFTDPAAYAAAIEAAFKAQYHEGCKLEPVIIDNGKAYSEGEYAAKVADVDLVTRAENKSARDLTAEERDALFASWRAQTLSDPAIDAAYQKAKQIVKVDIRAGGNRWHVQKKNGEWTLNKPYAMKRLYECGITDTDFIVKWKAEYTKCGLTEIDFIIKARAEKTACDLTAKLKDATRKADYMTLTTQSGEEFISRFGNVRVQPDGDGFIFTNGHETLARYDTKEQCEFVIDWIKKTVADSGNEFEFPTAELVALEMHAYELLLRYLKANYRYIGRHYWQMRIGDKWRNAPRRFMAADLKYYGLTPAQLKEAHHA